jgi:hypothetical protein
VLVLAVLVVVDIIMVVPVVDKAEVVLDEVDVVLDVPPPLSVASNRENCPNRRG